MLYFRHYFCTRQQIKHFQQKLTKKFQTHDSNQQFKKVSTKKEGKEFECVALLHKVKSSEINKFKTVNHIKSTAKSAKFFKW